MRERSVSESSSEDGHRETGRLEALSDGVFAIALTLLVLGIHVPAQDELQPGDTLVDLILGHNHWLSIVTYFISFLTILVMWSNHHSVFRYITRIDRPFIYLNGALLLMIVFVNYPTALVANFIGTSGATTATAIYSATLVVTAIFFNAHWLWAATGGRLLARDADPADVARITSQYRFGPLLYLAAFGLAFLNPWLSLALNAALGVYFAFTGYITSSRAK